MKKIYIFLILLVASIVLAQNTVVEQATDIFIRNTVTNAVALKVHKPADNNVPFIELGTRTNTWFSVGPTGAVTATAFIGDGSGLTNTSSSFNPGQFNTNGSGQVTIKSGVTNNNLTVTGTLTATNINGLAFDSTLFSKTSSVTFSNADPVVVIDSASALLAGFLHVYGTDGGGNEADIIFHVDITPATASIAICQFQGAQLGDPVKLHVVINNSNPAYGTEGNTLLSVELPSDNFVGVVEAYGTNLATLAFGTTNEVTDATADLSFTSVNGQIAANSLQAKTFTITDDAGGTLDVVESQSDVTKTKVEGDAAVFNVIDISGAAVGTWITTNRIAGTTGFDDDVHFNGAGVTVNGPLTISSNIVADGGGFKHKRITTGSINGNTATAVTVTWDTAFPNADYTVGVIVNSATTGLTFLQTTNITATAVTAIVTNITGSAITGTLHVTAVHD